MSAYIQLGRPDLPQLPLSARMQAEPQSTDIAMLITRAEEHLAANPNDGRGWDVLGPIYMRTGRFDDAVAALPEGDRAFSGHRPSGQASLGEALFSAAGGVVTEQASLAFQTARELDPTDPRPRFYLALALAQAGKTTEARAAFTGMLQTAPQDAPWIPAVQSQIAALQPDSGSAVPGNPSAADIAAAQNMSPADRQAMIGLDDRKPGGQARRQSRKHRRLAAAGAVLCGDRKPRRGASGAGPGLRSVLRPPGPERQALNALANELGLIATPTLGGVPVAPAAPAAPQSESQPSPAAKTPFILPDSSADAVPATDVVEPETSGGTASATPGGPSEAEIAAAAEMSPADRAAMIRGMVESLDARLAENPDNIEGWLRLVRSYAALGDRAAAEQALTRATDTFPGDSEGGRQLAGARGPAWT